jgi:hypothetical protein
MRGELLVSWCMRAEGANGPVKQRLASHQRSDPEVTKQDTAEQRRELSERVYAKPALVEQAVTDGQDAL